MLNNFFFYFIQFFVIFPKSNDKLTFSDLRKSFKEESHVPRMEIQIPWKLRLIFLIF